MALSRQHCRRRSCLQPISAQSATTYRRRWLHVDLVRAPQQFDLGLQAASAQLVLSLGVVDGRNVGRTDLAGLFRRRLLPVIHTGKNIVACPRRLRHRTY
ncbi:MAG: hypothetical protein ACREEJ_12420 [Ensifer adhaerens]